MTAETKTQYPPEIDAVPAEKLSAYGDFQDTRDAMQIGDVRVSVQASRTHYCTPRVNGLKLSEYLAVEVALLLDGELVTPKQIGIDGLPGHWDHDTVAGYVTHSDVAEIIRQLNERSSSQA